MQIDLGTLVVIVALAAASPLIVDVVPRIVLPVVVVEILVGIIVGPPILNLIHVTGLAQVLADFGLAFLFFLAGFELDLNQLRGMPARLALTGWGVSVALALVVAGLLEALDVVENTLFVGVALTTTALGTLAPILRDNGDGEGRFGALVAAAGAFGEVGPIILISLLLSETSNRGISALLLVAFGLVTGAAAFAAPRLKPVRILQVLEETMERTGQFAVRLALLILISLVYLSSRLHLDLVLGAFSAGLLASIACRPRAKQLMQPRLDAVGFGVFIPIFFIVTGMQFDLTAITWPPPAPSARSAPSS
jgi:Kef-type K+ transport system membrane component KefB